MAQKENKKIFEVGDVVTTKLLRLSVKGKIDVVGRIKSINDSGFGIKEYLKGRRLYYKNSRIT